MGTVHFYSSVSSIYTGTLSFIVNQAIFNDIFGSNPVMLIFITRSYHTIEVSSTLRLKILNLCSLFQLHIFCDIIQLQYVGTTTYNSNQTMSNIALALSNLEIEFHFLIKLTPNDLYRRYIQYLLFLHSNAI